MPNRLKTWSGQDHWDPSLVEIEFNNLIKGTVDRTAGRWGAKDNVELTFGDDQDFSLKWDGTNLVGTFAGSGKFTLSNLTASRLLQGDSDKGITSVADLTAWVAGGTGVDVVDDGDGTITLNSNDGEIDHGGLGGLGDDDHTQYLLAAGTRALSANWDAGSFQIRAETFQSDVVTGTAPFTVASTTVVTNLNSDLLDGQSGAHYLDSANFTGTNWTDLTDAGATTLHKHDHGGMDGLGDDDHSQYALLAGRSGGQTLIGGTASGNDLTLQSTSHATKGTIFFGAAGSSGYDEVNDRLGVGTTSPETDLHVFGGEVAIGQAVSARQARLVKGTVGTTDANTSLDFYWSYHPTFELGHLNFHASQDSGALVTFQSNGLVGINDTSPDAQLDVVAGSASTVGLIVEAAASQTANLFEINSNGGSGGDYLRYDPAPSVADGNVVIKANATNVAALELDTQASNITGPFNIKYNGTFAFSTVCTATASKFVLQARNLGNDTAGPSFRILRNSSASTEGSAAATLNLHQADATDRFLWADNTGDLRIHTAAPTGSSGSPTVSDTAGVVVGDQTSTIAEKFLYGPGISPEEALAAVAGTEIHEFSYRSGRYNGQHFHGIAIEDGDEWFAKDNGKSLNEITMFGYLIQAIKALQDKIEG